MISPATEEQAADAVKSTAASGRKLRIEGGGTRAALGRPVTADEALSTRALSGVTLYEPSELVISAKAGTPLSQIEAAISAHGQMLPFEPMDHRALLGTAGEPTIGGVAACGVSGPRRIQQGAARDHLLGVRFVNGSGEIIKSGGRVMKNVTGLDLVKVSCGAYGTLGLLTEVTFKLRPKPLRTGTLVIGGLDDARAVAALSMGLGSPFEVSAAAHLPAGILGQQACTLLRIENFSDSVDYRLGELAKLLADFGPSRRLEELESLPLWRDIRDVAPLAMPRERVVWRISASPTDGPKIVAALQAQFSFRHFYDWGGGLIWLACEAGQDAQAAAIRTQTQAFNAHAMLVRAPDELRARVDVFEPQAAGVMQLTAGIKRSMDPHGLYNPGRMYAGV
jgi:glycolate oxidase FAD binding subunit